MEALHLISDSTLEKLQSDLSEIKKLVEKQPEELFRFTWVESQRIPKLLNISNRTWQSYRDKRIIPFSQFGSKIYVRLSDIDSFLDKHLISKK